MQVQAYCPICKKTFLYELELEQTSEGIEKSGKAPDLMGIPLPNQGEISGSGLYTYSVIHDDHILVLEIDKNGAVRKTETVSLIQSSSQKIIAGLTATLWERANKKTKKILIISEREIWNRVLELVTSQLLIDKTNHKEIDIEGNFNEEESLLKVGKVQIKSINDFKKLVKEKGGYTDLILDITTVIDKNPEKFVNDLKAMGIIAMTFNESTVLKQQKNALNKWFDLFLEKAKGKDVLIYDSSDMKNSVKILTTILLN